MLSALHQLRIGYSSQKKMNWQASLENGSNVGAHQPMILAGQIMSRSLMERQVD